MGGATEGVVFLWFCRTMTVEEKVGMLSYVGSEIFHSCAPELGGARVSRPKRTQLYVLTSFSEVFVPSPHGRCPRESRAADRSAPFLHDSPLHTCGGLLAPAHRLGVLRSCHAASAGQK
ncbi:hypothetical protein ACE6H2_016712 [Prunus campanulata]